MLPVEALWLPEFRFSSCPACCCQTRKTLSPAHEIRVERAGNPCAFGELRGSDVKMNCAMEGKL